MNRELLTLARNSIKRELNLEVEPIERKLEWQERRGSFVTLTIDGRLRGCIGSLEAIRPLHKDIESNAIAAAFRDPRFPPITAEELDTINIELSILSPLTPIEFKDEEDLLTQLIPYKMGLLLEYGRHRGTFLPQVWENYPAPKEFFDHLKLKAGLPQSFFDNNLKLYYYEVEKCQE